jgi:hypothetical protein
MTLGYRFPVIFFFISNCYKIHTIKKAVNRLCKHNPTCSPINMIITLTASNGTAILYSQSRLTACCGRLYRTHPYTASLIIRIQDHRPETITLHNTQCIFTLLIASNHPTDTYDSTIAACSTDESNLSKTSMFIDNVNPKWRRIQRWMRSRARIMLINKKLALAMALHTRLGTHCSLAAIGVDCIKIIAVLLNRPRSPKELIQN